MMKIFIFDFDGTIADTHEYIIEISNRLCQEYNFKFIQPHEVEFLKNQTTQFVIQYLNVPVLKIPSILAKAKVEFQKEIEKLKPFEGLREALQKIKASGKQMGILSSNAGDNIEAFLENHNLNIFDFIHPTMKVWSKNTCLKKLIEKYHFPKDQILYIGDEVRDINAAKKLGVKIACVAWGYNSAEILKKHNPDFILHSPVELLKLI